MRGFGARRSSFTPKTHAIEGPGAWDKCFIELTTISLYQIQIHLPTTAFIMNITIQYISLEYADRCGDIRQEYDIKTSRVTVIRRKLRQWVGRTGVGSATAKVQSIFKSCRTLTSLQYRKTMPVSVFSQKTLYKIL